MPQNLDQWMASAHAATIAFTQAAQTASNGDAGAPTRAYGDAMAALDAAAAAFNAALTEGASAETIESLRTDLLAKRRSLAGMAAAVPGGSEA